MTAQRARPSETETDRLLASRLASTTPEFERRWRDQLRLLRSAPRLRPWWRLPRGTWLGLAASGAAAAVWLLLMQPAPSRPPEFSEAFRELAVLDPLFNRALPLLDGENRDALLHLPANPPPSR